LILNNFRKLSVSNTSNACPSLPRQLPSLPRELGVNWGHLGVRRVASFNATNNAVIDEPTGRIDAQEKRDSIMTNVRNFGRNKNYTHGLNVTYTVPLKQIPFLDWMTVEASYNSNYSWSAAALNLDSLGNVIQNGNGRQLNADLNFEKLYNKSKYLKKISSGAKKRKGATKNNLEIQTTKKKVHQIRKKTIRKRRKTKNRQKLLGLF